MLISRHCDSVCITQHFMLTEVVQWFALPCHQDLTLNTRMILLLKSMNRHSRQHETVLSVCVM